MGKLGYFGRLSGLLGDALRPRHEVCFIFLSCCPRTACLGNSCPLRNLSPPMLRAAQTARRQRSPDGNSGGSVCENIGGEG